MFLALTGRAALVWFPGGGCLAAAALNDKNNNKSALFKREREREKNPQETV